MDDEESALDKCVRACQKLNRARHAADIAVQSGVCLLQNAKSNAQFFRHVQPVSAVSRFPLH